MLGRGGQRFAVPHLPTGGECLYSDLAMANSKLPTGSAAGQDGRPRAQVAYEGEDEFSAMSLDPARKKTARQAEALAPGAPGQRKEVKVDELKSTNESGIVGLFRKIFAR
jgi:hypothetical protein